MQGEFEDKEVPQTEVFKTEVVSNRRLCEIPLPPGQALEIQSFSQLLTTH